MAVKLSNNATSTLSAPITATATSLTVQVNEATRFPTLADSDWFPATLVSPTGAMEIVHVTARNGATMTIRRGQEGTTAKDFPVAAKVDLRLTVAALLDAVHSVSGDFAVTGGVSVEGGLTVRGNIGVEKDITVTGLIRASSPEDGDDSNTVPVTSWVNAAIASVIDALNINAALDKKANISDLAKAVPAGAIMSFASAVAPDGWMKANGAAVSRTVYANLFAAIGTVFGAGDGSTTFNLPDMRGMFARGLDDGRGVDANRVLGSTQASQNAAHTHGVNDPGHSHTLTGFGNSRLIIASGGGFWYGTGYSSTATTGISISSSGGSEARPINIAMMYCIKY